jgi:hypothetical protein
MEPSKQQRDFVEYVKRAEQGEQISLDGGAGSGKSFTINLLCDEVPNILRCASTGSAGVLVGGVTAHNLFCIPTGGAIDPRLSLNAYRHKLMVKMNGGREPNQAELRGLYSKTSWLFPKKKLEVINLAHRVVLDEKSMCRCDHVDWIDKFCKRARKNPNLPFGGLTIIWAGDDGQLPSVVKGAGKDGEIIKGSDMDQLISFGYKAPFGMEEAMIFRED